MRPLRVGFVGVGNISGIYFQNLKAFPATEVVACADIDPARTAAVAEQHGVRAMTPDELIASPDVDLVLNLTIPKVHGDVALQAVRAGKHVYNEKPLTIDLDQARLLLDEADANGVRVGCAPDTFLGSGQQTARAAIEAGLIGTPIGAQAFMIGHGPEAWHPNPDFFYKPGGGPMLDMGPYYVTALVNMLGPVKRLTGSARASFAQRPVVATNKNFYDTRGGEPGSYSIDVETPTHLTAVLDFEGGAIGELTTSFDVWHTEGLFPIAVYGSEGSMLVPDPNNFGGDVKVRRHDESEWRVLPVAHGFTENSRGLGVLDIAYALEEGREHRASGRLALHALDVMLGVARASEEGRHQLLSSGTRPEALTSDAFADQR
ncbi:Gfo/Idh/MocA family oxidoreductase [bacterium]|nr:MAG: Gfo/Idh/MocA family oxidoreductase [bacterium]